MEIVLLVPMLIIIFAGVVTLFIAGAALFPIALVTLLVMLFRRRADDSGEKDGGERGRRAQLMRRRLSEMWQHLFHHRTASGRASAH